MRIALAAEGSRGDIHPLLALGAALRAQGHEPVLCVPPDFVEAARAHGVAQRSVGPSVREYLTRQARVLHGSPLDLLREIQRYGKTVLAAHFEALPEAVRGADLVVAGGVQLAARSAAEVHGIPYRYVVYCPALFPSGEHGPPFLPLPPAPRWVHRAAWRVLRIGWNLGFRHSLNAYRAGLGLAPVSDLLSHYLGEHPLLAADRVLAPLPGDLAFEVAQVPCLHPFDASEPLPEKLEQFLSAGPPPVYFGFGSMTDPDPQASTAQILEVAARLGLRAILGSGWAGLGAGPLPEGVMAIGSVSHACLFSRVAAVVHHGGAGTTTTAARAGVPQVVVPHVLDQFYWARRVAALGIGVVAGSRRGLAVGVLAEALDAVLGNELVAERARELAGRLRGERMRATAAVEALVRPTAAVRASARAPSRAAHRWPAPGGGSGGSAGGPASPSRRLSGGGT
jgi:vancomycin aglycone glucosyltransferase